MKTYHPGMELKQKNRNSIYRLIHRMRCVPKRSIVSELALSLPTVTTNLEELMRAGLIQEQGSFGNTGGRRARGYAVVADAMVAAGLDINRNHCSFVLIDLLGDVIAHCREYRLFEDTDSYYKFLSEKLRQMIGDHSIPPEKVLGVGIAIQGIVNAEHSAVSYGQVLGITGLTVDRIARYIPFPCSLFHDSDMAAFAETWNKPKAEEAVYLSLSTNLGGAVVEPNQTQRTTHFGRARVEHMTIVPHGQRCYCGQKGCADVYCSTMALTRHTADNRLDTFFYALKQRDPVMVQAWDEYLDYLAIILNNVRMMYDCQVILGGYMAAFLEEYMPDLTSRAYRRNSFAQDHDYIQLAAVRTEPVAIGAALQFIEAFIANI